MRIHSRFLLSLGLTAVFGITACTKDTDDGNDVVPMGVKIDSFMADKQMVAMSATMVLSYQVSNATNVSISASPNSALLTESTTFMGTVTSAAIREPTTFTLTANG